eukprot:c3511_g1_i1.p1 GENE.c3511_g1_i1~~c3511_g1_i1.p1  ORF type:complete len:145 (+),score=16.49 c3511_g1_i1:30-464(+)
MGNAWTNHLNQRIQNISVMGLNETDIDYPTDTFVSSPTIHSQEPQPQNVSRINRKIALNYHMFHSIGILLCFLVSVCGAGVLRARVIPCLVGLFLFGFFGLVRLLCSPCPLTKRTAILDLMFFVGLAGCLLMTVLSATVLKPSK